MVARTRHVGPAPTRPGRTSPRVRVWAVGLAQSRMERPGFQLRRSGPGTDVGAPRSGRDRERSSWNASGLCGRGPAPDGPQAAEVGHAREGSSAGDEDRGPRGGWRGGSAGRGGGSAMGMGSAWRDPGPPCPLTRREVAGPELPARSPRARHPHPEVPGPQSQASKPRPPIPGLQSQASVRPSASLASGSPNLPWTDLRSRDG
jgi:hypothetical protein